MIFPHFFVMVLFSTAITTEARKTVILKNQATKKCLDTTLQGLVYAIPCNGGDHQEWVIENDRSLSNLGTKRCLDSNGKNVYAIPCNGGVYQQWGTSHVHLQNEASGMCLEDDEYTNDVKVAACDDENKHQMWGEPGPDGNFKDEL